MNERRRLPGFDLRGRARPIRLLLGYGFAFAFSFATALVGAATARANTEPAATASCREAAPVEASSEAGAALARGNALLAVDRPLDALDAYSESERLARAEGDLRLALLAAANRARALLAADRTQELAQELDRIAELARQNEQSESATLRATVLVNLAQSYARFTGPGTPDRATRIARAAELLVEAEAAAGEASDRRLRSYALGYRAALYAEAERTDEALTLTRRALLEADAANAPDAAYRWLWQIGRLQRRSGDAGAAVDAYRQSKRILDGMRADQVVDESRFREEVQPVYRELADLLLVRARAQTEGPEKQRLLEEVRATLESFRVAELREYFGDACLDAQSRAMPESVPGTVVLHPIVLPDRVELLVSRGDGLVSVLAPISGDALETEIREFRRLVTDRTSRAYLRPSRRLYEWLIRPIAPTLADEELQALVILPEGSLRTIPFAALQDERTGRFLIEQTPLAIVPSLLLIEPRRLDAPRARVLGGGVASAVQGFSALDGVPDEMLAIGSHFEGRLLLDDEFRADRFEAELERAPFQIVHIASHGEFRRDASESFVLAWDRKISMDQLSRTIAQTRFRTDEPLELLVLSACESAAGDDRAALGLAGVALQSGARSAVATLWTVGDRASVALISRFYAELANGTSRATALQRAQVELLRGDFAHPFSWAAFVLISSWL